MTVLSGFDAAGAVALGHANLGTTSIYLQGIDPEDIIAGRPHAPGADDPRAPACRSVRIAASR